MSGFSGINQFGSLTTQSGARLTFKDFDKDGDGKISEQEYNDTLKENKIDTIELSTVDKSGDKEISEDEFATYEQKLLMQDAVNELKKQISTDFCGSKSQYFNQIADELKAFIDDFAANYTGEIDTMANDFKTALPQKYNEIKANILANDPSTIKSNTLETFYTNLISQKDSGMTDAVKTRVKNLLNKEADNFVKNYKGDNLAADLQAHLENVLTKSDAQVLADDVNNYQATLKSMGNFVDSDELALLKDSAKDLLLSAINNGITVKLGNTTLKTEANITAALKQYNDAESLNTAMNEFINSLNTDTKLNIIKQEEAQKAQEAADKAFTDIKGSEYAINPSLIDKTQIPGYGSQIHERGKGWSGSRDKAYAKGQEFLNNGAIKSQMKAQIKSMLESKGISFEKIETVFENTYNKSIQDALNADGIITGRGARGLSSKGHAYIDTAALLTKFVEVFNTNIAQTIDEMNASNQDLDLQDLDYSVLAQDENGNETNPELTEAVKNNSSIKVSNHTAKMDIQKIFTRMKPQMLQKAKAMCDANNITFNLETFNTIYNNATIAAEPSLSTVDKIVLGFTGKRTINPAQIVNTLTTEFKTNYTAWVDAEKAKAKK